MESRKRAGLSQHRLAIELGDRYDHSVISRVEHGHSKLALDGIVRAARTLEVSLDYLTGLTDDPTPAAELVTAREEALAEEGTRGVEMRALGAAAGAGAAVLDETVTGRLLFTREWMDRHGLDPTQCVVIRAVGDSMQPTLPDGCSILVNRASRRRRMERVYVLRTGEGLVVKRLGRDERGRWLMLSDSKDQETHPPQVWTDEVEIIGEVKWQGKTV